MIYANEWGGGTPWTCVASPSQGNENSNKLWTNVIIFSHNTTHSKSAHRHKLEDHKLILDQRLKILYIYDQMSFWYFLRICPDCICNESEVTWIKDWYLWLCSNFLSVYYFSNMIVGHVSLAGAQLIITINNSSISYMGL